MRKLKRLLVSLTAAALVMGNVAALTTFTARAEEENGASDVVNDESAENAADEENEATSEIVVSVTPAAEVVVTKAPEAGSGEDTVSVTPTPKQIVTAGGTVLEGDALNAVNEFLESLEVTEDFAVYTDDYTSQCNHVEGNIAVNTLNSQTGDGMLIKGDTSEALDGGQYSYIGSSDQSVGSYGSVILTNGTLDETTQTSGTDFVTVGGAIGFDGEGKLQVDEEKLATAIEEVSANVNSEDVAQAIKINENLDRISDAAANLDAALDEVLAEEDATPAKTAVNAVTGMLTENTVQKGDVVVIDIPALGINDLCNELQNLYNVNKNVGATLLVRVNTKELTSATISITIPLNGEYKGAANGYLIWDFGTFNGEIVQTSAIAGVIVAPNALVSSYDTVEGRVVAGSHFHNGSETHQPGKEEPTPTPEEEEPTPTVTITDTPTPTSATPTPTTTVTITDTPVPLGDTPEEGEVLGARRTPAVPEQGEVLGARRAPQTGDTAEANLWLSVLFGAAAGLGTWAFLKKRDEKRAQAG